MSRPSSATASGVPPARAMRSTAAANGAGGVAPASTESTAPLRQARPPASSPLTRVCAVNGITFASAGRSGLMPCRSRTKARIERPSGVSSPTEARAAASARPRSSTPGTGARLAAMRLPKVIVPVLSSSRVSTSPAASTARPEVATTLKRISRSMPAMPMALSRPPMVVGIRVTSRADSTGTLSSAPL